ncbi:MAG: helix-turn-helix transcriptional regulator [Pelobacteraceae bacterium]
MHERRILTALEIGKTICRRRQELGLTQDALADRIAVTCQQVQRYEYGKNKLNIENLQLIAKALAVPVSYFFTRHCMTEQVSKEDHLNPSERKVVEMFRRIDNGEVKSTVVKLLKAASGGKRA